MLKKTIAPIAAVLALALAPLGASADVYGTDFEAFDLGLVHLQDGWSSLGSAGGGCATYDVEVVDSSGHGIEAFGEKSLRISNAVTTGCFGDQTFTASLADAAGEVDAANGVHSSPAAHDSFVARWEFASTDPTGEQVKLSTVASADRGDGARMTWVQMADTPDGLAVNFFDYQSGANEEGCTTGSNFVFSPVATGLDRAIIDPETEEVLGAAVHSIRVEVDFFPGPSNDVVRVYVDGELGHTGTTWEDYFRECEGSAVSRTVDSTLFRVGGSSCPGVHCNAALAGKGFLIDNYSQSSTALFPTSIDAEPALIDVSGPTPYLLQLEATLSSSAGPVAGADVEFEAHGVVLCATQTDADGVATCDALTGAADVLLVGGYTVTYDGSYSYGPSTGRAGLIEV